MATSQTRLFHFPNANQIPVKYKSLQELNRTMDMTLKNHNQKSHPSNKIQKTMVIRQTQTGAVMRCKVRGCGAYIQFNRQNDGYVLCKMDPEHEHRIRSSRKGRLPKIRNSEVQQCYDQLQLLNFKPREIVQYIRNKFKITKAHFYGIKFCRNKRQNIRNLLMALSKYDHFFFECKDMRELVAHYKNQKFPDNIPKQRDIVLLVSKKMKQLYENYHGQYVYFSIFPDLVLQTRYTKTLHYQHLGVLYGQDASGSLNLMFGITIIRKPIRLAYLYVLQKFFSFLGNYPKVIVTDYDQALAQAIKRLHVRCKVQGALKQHIQLPNSFITNSFQQRINPQFLAVLSTDLESTLRDPDHKNHHEKVKRLMQACQFIPPPTQQRIAQQVDKYIRSSSILHLHQMFIGLTLSPYSAASLLRARVLDFFKSPRPMILAVKAFFQIFKSYNILKFLSPEQIEARINPPKECSTKAQKLQLLQMVAKQMDPNTKMKQIIKAISPPAALCFYDMLEQCFKGEIQFVQQKDYYFYRVIETQVNYPYTIKKIIQTINGEKVRLWRCDCRYYFKVGMPCWHEMKACLIEKADMTLQINQYWLKQEKGTDFNTVQRSLPEHDVKHWEQESNIKQMGDFTYQNKDNEEAANKPNDFFTYDQKQPLDQQSLNGIGQLMQQLQVLQWELNSLDQNQNNEEKSMNEGYGGFRSQLSGTNLSQGEKSIIQDLAKFEQLDDGQAENISNDGNMFEKQYEEFASQKENTFGADTMNLWSQNDKSFNFDENLQQDIDLDDQDQQYIRYGQQILN